MPKVEPVPDSAPDHEPDTVATPEGDNEYAPDQPLVPSNVDADIDGLKTPRGNAPKPYYADEHHEPSGIEKFIDEISTGKIMP